jgi:hypothetical protein
MPRTDRPYRWPVAASVIIHALLLALFVGHEVRDVTPDNPRDSKAPGAPGRRGGGGGETFRIELPPYQQEQAPPGTPTPVERPPVPQVVVKPPPIKVQKLELPTQGPVTSSVDISGLATGQGPGKGGGVGTGLGPGVGADSGSGSGGEGGDVFPPKQKYAILPPLPQPTSVRGQSFQVHFWVSADGRVTAVKVDPEIKDAAYRKQFIALMREYTFEPAHKLDGTRVDGEMTITIAL